MYSFAFYFLISPISTTRYCNYVVGIFTGKSCDIEQTDVMFQIQNISYFYFL